MIGPWATIYLHLLRQAQSSKEAETEAQEAKEDAKEEVEVKVGPELWRWFWVVWNYMEL